MTDTAERRARWRKLHERDLDLLVLDLLHTAPTFRERLIDHCGLRHQVPDPTGSFLEAWHSVVNTDGRESDLEAEWQTQGGGRFRLLIEDKVGAAFTPGQPERYAARAAEYENTVGQSASTLLIAPESYAVNHKREVGSFASHLSIEGLTEWCADGVVPAPRSDYLRDFLNHLFARNGVRSRASSGGAGKATFPSLYRTIRSILAVEFPELSITNSSDGEWVYFGFPDKARVSLCYRLRDHWAELVFSRKRLDEATLLAIMQRTGLPGAKVDARGMTEVVLWRPTPEIDPTAAGDEQQQELEGALAVVASLASWYRQAMAREE